MEEEADTEEAQMPLSQSLESVTRKIQIKTKGKVFAVVRESYLRNWSQPFCGNQSLNRFRGRFGNQSLNCFRGIMIFF
jgi:hypothetical protein